MRRVLALMLLSLAACGASSDIVVSDEATPVPGATVTEQVYVDVPVFPPECSIAIDTYERMIDELTDVVDIYRNQGTAAGGDAYYGYARGVTPEPFFIGECARTRAQLKQERKAAKADG